MKKAIVLFLLLGIFALPVRSYASPAGYGSIEQYQNTSTEICKWR